MYFTNIIFSEPCRQRNARLNKNVFVISPSTMFATQHFGGINIDEFVWKTAVMPFVSMSFHYHGDHVDTVMVTVLIKSGLNTKSQHLMASLIMWYV